MLGDALRWSKDINKALLLFNRSDLEPVMMGVRTLDTQIEDGTAKLEGDADVLTQLASTWVHFDLAFEILPGTVESVVSEDLNEFEVGAAPITHE